MGSLRTLPLLAFVIGFSVLASGCLFPPPPPPKFTLTLLTDTDIDAQPNWTVGWALEAYQAFGDNQNATLTADVPSGWSSHFLKGAFSFNKSGDRHATFLLVGVPDGEQNNTYEVRIHAAIGDQRADATGKVKVTRPQTNLVHNGSKVKMDYVGFLADNQVFDTSMWGVANSSGLDRWPDFKNSSAGRRQSDYNPLETTLGHGGLILGWEIGLQNMSLGQSKALVIPPELAYGRFRDQSVNLTEVIPIYNTTTAAGFRSQYGFEAAEDLQFIDPVYGWTRQVVNVDNATSTVTVKSLPSGNASYTPYGINATIANLSSALGTFEVHYTPTFNQSTTFQGDTGVVTSLNETAFVIHWQTDHRNSLAPHTLYFIVFVRSAQG